MPKKKDKKKAKKKDKDKKKSKSKKKLKLVEPKAETTAPTQQPPKRMDPPLGMDYVWTMEDDFLTGQIFEHFSQGRGTMTANEFGKALNSMGYGRPKPQGPQVFPRTENQEVPSKVQRNTHNIDSFSTSSNINSDMFQSGYMSLTPWWITNDRLVGKTYQGADLAIAEARRRRKFSERAMNELSCMRG